jgi:hypothetical protein
MKNIIKKELIYYMNLFKNEMDLPDSSFTEIDAEFLAERIVKKIKGATK